MFFVVVLFHIVPEVNHLVRLLAPSEVLNRCQTTEVLHSFGDDEKGTEKKVLALPRVELTS